MHFATKSIGFVAVASLSAKSRLALSLRVRNHGIASSTKKAISRKSTTATSVAAHQLAATSQGNAEEATTPSPSSSAAPQQASGIGTGSSRGILDSDGDGNGGRDGGADGNQTCVVSTALAFLEGKKRIVERLTPADYTAVDQVIGASVGGHMRHTLDHFAKCLAAAAAASTPTSAVGQNVNNNNKPWLAAPGRGGDTTITEEIDSAVVKTIRYDYRTRGGNVETDPAAAANLIASLQIALEVLPRGDAGSLKLRTIAVAPAFLLGEGGRGGGGKDGMKTEHVFESNLERELFFCCHHGFHHDAMIRLILARIKDDAGRVALEDESLGVAPSTAAFRQQQRQK